MKVELRRVDAGSAGPRPLRPRRAGGGRPSRCWCSARAGHCGLRRTFPGSTADRLLHGAGAPVTIVPWGYADLDSRTLSRVAVAYVDTPDGREAFRHAYRIAAHLGGSLTVLSVVPDTRVVPGLGESRQFSATERNAPPGQPRRGGEVGARRPPGDRTAAARPGRATRSPSFSLDEYDLLVIGSRGYEPVRRVLLGGVSSRVYATPRCPWWSRRAGSEAASRE